MDFLLSYYIVGLISQVAEELWEVKDKTIRNLTKEDISIVDYKKLLMKDSTFPFFFPPFFVSVIDTNIRPQVSPR